MSAFQSPFAIVEKRAQPDIPVVVGQAEPINGSVSTDESGRSAISDDHMVLNPGIRNVLGLWQTFSRTRNDAAAKEKLHRLEFVFFSTRAVTSH